MDRQTAELDTAAPPTRNMMSEQTRRLHDGVDAAIRRHAQPYLSPGGETIQLDLFGSEPMVAWQEEKSRRSFIGDACWSELPQIYGRYGSEHGRRLVARVRALESAAAVVLTDSGMSACALLIDVLFTPGSRAVLSRGTYNKTKAYVRRLASLVRGEVLFIDETAPDPIDGHVNGATRLILLETFSNPLTRALDIGAVVERVTALKKDNPGLRLIVDNTIATPWGTHRRLLDAGVDFVVASGTKALDGRDRNMWGYVASNDVRAMNELMDLQAMRGGALDGRRAESILSGLSESRARFARRCKTATRVAEFLASCPEISAVFHPSLKGHPDAAIIARQYALTGSLVSFRLRGADDAAARHFCDVLVMTAIPRYALSFDGLVTKVNHHRSVSEFHTSDAEVRALGVEGLVRLGIGLEDPEDLVTCLGWALRQFERISPEDVAAWRRERRRSLGLDEERIDAG